MNRLRAFFSHSVLLINILCVLWMAMCLLASVTSPEQVKHIQLFSLTTPFALVANGIFVLIWVFSQRKIRVIPSFLILAASYRVIPAVFGFHFFYEDNWQKGPTSFKLMSWNVHGMGIFNIPDEKKHAEGIVTYIQKQDPDILVVPEFSVKAITENSVYKSKILKNGRYKSYYFTSDNGLGANILIGTAIFSRFPIVNYQAVFLDPYISISYSDIVFQPYDTFRVFAVHLHTFGLTDNDKSYIEDIKKQGADGLGKSKSFLWKFNHAYTMRAEEADKLAGYIAESPHPVIVSGDFNDLPFSYTYTKIRGDLNDAFVDKGAGFGRTYNHIVPTLRIDHVLYDASHFTITAFETPYVALSDHSPIITQFKVKPGNHSSQASAP